MRAVASGKLPDAAGWKPALPSEISGSNAKSVSKFSKKMPAHGVPVCNPRKPLEKRPSLMAPRSLVLVLCHAADVQNGQAHL